MDYDPCTYTSRRLFINSYFIFQPRQRTRSHGNMATRTSTRDSSYSGTTTTIKRWMVTFKTTIGTTY
ncbi:hypothetical protein BDA99DRAFT_496428 [Phascolomyces articulosus]|uniref:Uncharacterized protein n=1 Tax=Phascolomyces articulosus TaxID=60185 RepID=A0AAD5KN57_9FUNG|nr:hypothetical protein BDA99DRAFT_496428 [Phascolomyces articulosus]